MQARNADGQLVGVLAEKQFPDEFFKTVKTLRRRFAGRENVRFRKLDVLIVTDILEVTRVYAGRRGIQKAVHAAANRSLEDVEGHVVVVTIDGKVVALVYGTHAAHVSGEMEYGSDALHNRLAAREITEISLYVLGEVNCRRLWGDIDDTDMVAFIVQAPGDGRALVGRKVS
jgi:hypothetical protein